MTKRKQTQLTGREREGVKAIKFLQGLRSIPETDAQAIAGWRGMSQHEQDFTLEFYRSVYTK